MDYVYNIFLHVLLVGAMLGFLIVLVLVAFRASDFGERVRRSLALFAGAMVVIGAQAAGVGFTTFTTGSLGSARAASLGAHIVSSIIPALSGLGIGFYMVRLYKKNEDFGMRVVCFVGMLAIAAFAEVYASATHTRGVFLGAAAVPNLSFAVAVLLVCVFADTSQVRPTATQAITAHPMFGRVKRALGYSDSTHLPSSGTSLVDPPPGQSAQQRRDPFSF